MAFGEVHLFSERDARTFGTPLIWPAAFFFPPVQEVSAADRTPGLIEIVDWKAESAVDGDSSAPQSLIGQVVPYWMQDIRSTVTLKAGDEVSLRLVRLKATQELIALDVQLAKAHEDSTERMIGPISDIKENFGFVELPSAKGEIFFHFSCVMAVNLSF